MAWTVANHDEFEPEFDALSEEVQDLLLAASALLETYGPSVGPSTHGYLGRVQHANMKELRFNAADGVWRVAFAFDPNRQAILLVAGDKSGVGQRRFYKGLIRVADKRFAGHLQSLKEN